jgi:hypothetical protein
MIIGIDFDGTCVTHEYPNIGKDIGAIPVLKKIIKKGHKIILFTVRCMRGEGTLVDAINWFRENDIPLYGVNFNPSQGSWTSSPKPYCHIYIDDSALGCPLVYPSTGRPYVNWVEVENILSRKGIL